MENAKTLLEEIELFARYCVPEEQLEEAMALVEGYRHDRLILRLFREYYSTVPEAREEAVVKIARLTHHQGVSLFVVGCTEHCYLYAVSVEQLLLLAQYQKEVSQEIVTFFGYSTQEEFLASCLPIAELEEYPRAAEEELRHCPACGVDEGELHLVGCSVEVCPWCDGQLSGCNCRFEQLGCEEIEDQQQLDIFIDLLTEKGRVPFRREQAPAYPGTSKGLDRE